MLGWMKRFGKKKNQEVIDALFDLREEFPDCRSYINDQILYATIGRDRNKLDSSWVEKTRKQCVEMQNMLGKVNAAIDDPDHPSWESIRKADQYRRDQELRQ